MTLPDIDDLATFGGEKEDFYPIEDPTTDVSADEGNQAMASTAAMTRVSTRAYAEFTGIASSPATVSYHESVWGNDSGVIPTFTRSAMGKFHGTWPATVADSLGVNHSLNLRRGKGYVTSGTTAAIVIVARTGPNTFDVSVYDMAGAATDLVGSTILVELF